MAGEGAPVTPPGADGPQGRATPPRPDHLSVVPDQVAQEGPGESRTHDDPADLLVKTPPYGTPAVTEGPSDDGGDGSGTDQGPHGRRAGRIVATVVGGSLFFGGSGYLAINAGSDGGTSPKNENPGATATVPFPESTLPGNPNGSITVPARTPEPTTTVKAKEAWEIEGTPEYALVQGFGYSADQVKQLKKTHGEDLSPFWHQIKFDDVDPSIPTNHVFNFTKVRFDEAAYKAKIIKVRTQLPGTTLNGLDPYKDGSNISITFGSGTRGGNKERYLVYGETNTPRPSWGDGPLFGYTDQNGYHRSIHIFDSADPFAVRTGNTLTDVELIHRETSFVYDDNSTFGPTMAGHLKPYMVPGGNKNSDLAQRPVLELVDNSATQIAANLRAGDTMQKASQRVDNIPSQDYPTIPKGVDLKTPEGFPFTVLLGAQPF